MFDITVLGRPLKLPEFKDFVIKHEMRIIYQQRVDDTVPCGEKHTIEVSLGATTASTSFIIRAELNDADVEYYVLAAYNTIALKVFKYLNSTHKN